MSLTANTREQGLTEVRQEMFLYGRLQPGPYFPPYREGSKKKIEPMCGPESEKNCPLGKPDLLTGSRECHSVNILPTNRVNNPYSQGKDYVKNGKCRSGLMDRMGLGILGLHITITFPISSNPIFKEKVEVEEEKSIPNFKLTGKYPRYIREIHPVLGQLWENKERYFI